MSEPCPHGLYAGCDHCVRLTLKHIEELEEVNIDLSDQLEREQIEHRREVMAHVETQRKLDAAERRIAELQQWEPDLSLYGKGEPKSLEELKASHVRLIGKSLADAYYAHFAEMSPRIKQRVSLEMLREIFDRMVVPAIREVGSLSSSSSDLNR